MPADRLARQPLTWFEDSPDAGDPNCLCSYCGHRIEAADPDKEDYEMELNADEGEPIRMWTNGGKDPCKEARFHARCFSEVMFLGLVTM